MLVDELENEIYSGPFSCNYINEDITDIDKALSEIPNDSYLLLGYEDHVIIDKNKNVVFRALWCEDCFSKLIFKGKDITDYFDPYDKRPDIHEILSDSEMRELIDIIENSYLSANDKLNNKWSNLK